MVYYDLTNITAANTTYELIRYINIDLTVGMLGIMMIVALFFIILINMSFYEAKHFFLIATFFITIIAGLAWIAGLVTMFVLIGCIILLVISTILAIWM